MHSSTATTRAAPATRASWRSAPPGSRRTAPTTRRAFSTSPAPTATCPGELEISSTWQPQTYDGGHETQSIIYYARTNGYLTGPGSIEYDDRTDEEEAGYCWLVYLDGPGSLKLSTYYQKIKWLGAGDVRGGADEALGVLRQAVFEANALLDDLDRYIAAREG